MGVGQVGKAQNTKKATYMQLGKYEIEDQITCRKMDGQTILYWRKPNWHFRMEFRWVYGKFSLNKRNRCLQIRNCRCSCDQCDNTIPSTLKIFWERHRKPFSGYDDNSPTTYAHLMKGKFLMIHGTADDNVHFQNAIEFSEALIQQNKSLNLWLTLIKTTLSTAEKRGNIFTKK